MTFSLVVAGASGDFQYGQESLLGDVDAADSLHAFLAFFLAFEELSFTRDIATIALREHIFSQGADGLARDDAATDGGLNRHFELLARNQFSQARGEFTAAFVSLFAMADERERVHRLAADENVELHKVRFAIAGEMIIERSVSARNALQTVVKIEDDFIQWHFVGEHDARWR